MVESITNFFILTIWLVTVALVLIFDAILFVVIGVIALVMVIFDVLRRAVLSLIKIVADALGCLMGEKHGGK
ncbi:hypothetical protein [Vibrio owensii]|uniref:hypothetical protein n=1 Tax=Vibrio owensii TaxID=696485 RepID=UPI0018F182EE|nr:hypothetical protein [Vibrio owensii]